MLGIFKCFPGEHLLAFGGTLVISIQFYFFGSFGFGESWKLFHMSFVGLCIILCMWLQVIKYIHVCCGANQGCLCPYYVRVVEGNQGYVCLFFSQSCWHFL
uniref:Uncharacterized protein n=1 Tax=Rhizophora mucronata TaxID=61149 RepID=A0A2P2IYZ3_RHIMU